MEFQDGMQEDNNALKLNVNELIIEIKNESNRIINKVSGMEDIICVYPQEYRVGDKICFTNLSQSRYLVIKIDNELSEALIYVPSGKLEFMIPFAEDSIPYPPNAFKGNNHRIHLRSAKDDEVYCYRNLAENVMDQRGETSYYPHATANVETRNEAVFAARNTIDGQLANKGHGVWPYESWGTWQRADAQLTVDFGRPVDVDKIAVYLRADFPHDTYWNMITIVFSDGTEKEVELIKTDQAQYIAFDAKRINWVKLMNFKKADEPAEFAALTEIQVYGVEVINPVT